MQGWIKLHRKFLKWEWFNDNNMVMLFIYLLLKANFEATKWKGIDVKRGQLITGINSLSKATGISSQTIRTGLKRLKLTKEITIESTNQYSIVTICNYDSYQPLEVDTNNPTNSQLTSDQQTTNKRPTTDKNEKNEKNIDKRKQIFFNQLSEYIKTYNKKMIRSFYDYWTEINKSGTKLKFEMQNTWELTKRLKRWSDNNKQFDKKETTQYGTFN